MLMELKVMRQPQAATLYRSTVGKKILMAVTGIFLLLFVIGHMLGNLKIFAGQEKFDGYAHWLREMGAPLFGHGQALWLVRIVLLAAVALHIVAAVQLTLTSWRARDVKYHTVERLAFSYASYTMRWGGVVVALYVIYHLLHLTWGVAHPDFGASPYRNVVTGFQVWWVALVYMLAMIPLGLHLYHGIWSGMQTLGVNDPSYNDSRRPIAAVVAILIVVGYLTVPIAVLTGLIE
jgi:succinate dehydrogenase / fumarate reductase cytochrome b subunit